MDRNQSTTIPELYSKLNSLNVCYMYITQHRNRNELKEKKELYYIQKRGGNMQHASNELKQ